MQARAVLPCKLHLANPLWEVLDLVELNYLGNLLTLPIVEPNTCPNLKFLGIPIDLPIPPLPEQLCFQIFVSTSQTLHVAAYGCHMLSHLGDCIGWS